MKLFFIICLSALNFFNLLAAEKNYCTFQYTKLCQTYDDELTLCGAMGRAFAGSCPKDARMFDAFENKFLNFLNSKRQEVALQVPASKMNRIHWCKELAIVAENSVRLCNEDIEFCPLTPRFREAHIFKKEYPSSAKAEIDISTLNSLWKGYSSAYMNDTKHFVNKKDAEGYAHFSEDRVTHVGCAISRYTSSDSVHKFLLACVFSHSPYFLQPYVKGPPASECTSGEKSLDYEGLCEVSDDVLKRVSDIC